MAMSSPHEVPVKVLVSETLSERSVEGGNVGERRRPEEQVQRRPKKELGASRGKSGALGMPLSYGRQHGLSMDGVDSASERAEMENVEEVDKAAAAGIVGASPAQTVANLHNASNLPKEVAKQVEQYEMELRKNPREVSALMGWARLLVKVAKDVIATHTSPESVKTDVRLIKDSLFVACTKFQDASEIKDDDPFILVEWADTLILIASNFDLPLFDMAMEKYMAASMMKPKCHNILQRYGLALAKQATFVYAHGSAVEPRTSAELDSESERMLTEALKLKPNSFSTLICWTESLAERLRRTLSNEVVISILRELGDTFIKALHLKPYRCFILQNWAYALDQTLESMVQYGLLSEDEFMPVFLDFCQAYQFLSGLERVSKGDSRKKSTTSSNSDSTDSTDPNFSISSSKIGEMNSSLLSPPQPDSGKIPKTHLNASVLRSSKSSQILSSGSEVLTIAMGNNSSASQALRSASPAPSSTTFVDPFDNDDWEPKITVTVPLKPLMAFSLMEHSERVGQKAFELLEFMAKNAKNLDTREEAQRHVECLKVLFANKKEIQASNLKRAEETIGLLPVKALRDWERSGLTIEQVAQKFDIFMNCLYFIVDKDTARDPVFNQQKKKRTLQMAPGGSSHHNAHGNSTSANPPNAHGISQTSQNFSPSSSLSNLPQHISPSSSTSSVHQSVAGEGKKATQGQAQKAVASTSAQLSSSPSNVVATSSTAGTTPPSGVSSPYLSDTSTSTGSSTSTTPVAVPAVVVAPSGVNSSTTPAVSSAAYPALRKTLSYDEFEKIVRRENPRTFYSHLVSIGQGGFGEVFTCESTSTGKKVAMKVMPAPSLNSDFLQKHTNEIEAMRRLNHPNIVQFEDVFYYDNQVWLVMEYCDGGTLENLYQEVYLSESEIAYFIRQICIGLNYLHIQQLAHLDIKAENILLNLNGGIKIADFGLVREVAADRDTLTSMVGTSYWMAPEVIQRKPYGQKVDIWALGCVCLELCEGRPPRHEQGSLKAMFLTATQGPPTFNPRPENGHPWSEKMIDFLKQTMHVDPRRRPTASQLLEHPFLQSRTLSVKELRKKLELVFIGASLRANGLL